jgi:cytochrome P450
LAQGEAGWLQGGTAPGGGQRSFLGETEEERSKKLFYKLPVPSHLAREKVGASRTVGGTTMGASLAAERNLGETVDLAELWRDPYPTFAALRRHEPVAWVPAANRYLVTRHADIVALERDPETFSAAEESSLMIRVMGPTMLRKDGAAHRRERAALEPAMRPATVKNRWMPCSRRSWTISSTASLRTGKPTCSIGSPRPAPARCLGQLLGLYDVDQMDLRTWSQAMMDGTGNYANDPEIWRRCDDAVRGVDAALDAAIAHLRTHPDESLISCMLHADDPLSREEIGGNVKVIIGGGLNEPRDAITTALYGLLTNPDQLAQVLAQPALWRAVFEETIRWVAPIGMYPRQTTRACELGGVAIPARARIGVVLASGNRDETVFDNPDAFDINRPKKPHVALAAGRTSASVPGWRAPRSARSPCRRSSGACTASACRMPSRCASAAGSFRGPLNLPACWDA